MDKITSEEKGKRAHSVASATGTTKKQTLKAAGLSQSIANRCEKIAEIPEEKFQF